MSLMTASPFYLGMSSSQSNGEGGILNGAATGTSISESPPFVISSHLLSTSPANAAAGGIGISSLREQLMSGNTGARPRSYSFDRHHNVRCHDDD